MKRFALTTLCAATLGLAIAPLADAAKLTQSADQPQPFNVTAVQLAEATGEFVTVEQDHPTTGTASVVMEEEQTYLAFDEAFSTASGPDVQVVLYEGSEVPVNLEEGDYITLAPLESFDGAQRYLIPADVDLSDYEAVGIWCRQFNVTFGYATL